MVSNQRQVNSKNNTITSRQDEEEKQDKVNDLDDFYEGDNRVRIKQKSNQRKYGNMRIKANKNNFESPQKKKLKHYVIPKNIHPLQAIQNGISRARKFYYFTILTFIFLEQQLQIARILKVKQ